MDADAPRLDPRRRRLIAAAALVAVGASVVGGALAPYLLVHHPVLLLALAPEPRHVVLATPLLPGAVIIPLTVLRRVLGLVALYLFGWAYGEGAIRFIEGRSGRMGRFLRTVQRYLARWGAWLVLVLPMPSVVTLAGAGNVRLASAVPAIVVGQTFWVTLTWAFGDLLTPFVRPVLDWLSAHVLEATLVTILAVTVFQLVTLWRRRRAARAPTPPSE
ncbi:MAG: hypothetical protein KF729_35585 [Sandaracinaceae bacterium]|nr:hypothetical protein [Sandaracinaceae bacterium]